MTKGDWECHITIDTNNSPEAHEKLKELVELLHWRFSKIDGDPALGQGVRCYATQLYHDKDVAVYMTVNAASFFLSKGWIVVRRKVEHVIHDTNWADSEKIYYKLT